MPPFSKKFTRIMHDSFFAWILRITLILSYVESIMPDKEKPDEIYVKMRYRMMHHPLKCMLWKLSSCWRDFSKHYQMIGRSTEDTWQPSWNIWKKIERKVILIERWGWMHSAWFWRKLIKWTSTLWWLETSITLVWM